MLTTNRQTALLMASGGLGPVFQMHFLRPWESKGSSVRWGLACPVMVLGYGRGVLLGCLLRMG